MKRIISLILSIGLLISGVLGLVGCNNQDDTPNCHDIVVWNDQTEYVTLYVPTGYDFDGKAKKTIDAFTFDKTLFENAKEEIEGAIALLSSENEYETVKTYLQGMTTDLSVLKTQINLAYLERAKNITSQTENENYAFAKTSYAQIQLLIDDLYRAAAKSTYKINLENDVFGIGALDGYTGEKSNEALKTLFEKENEIITDISQSDSLQEKRDCFLELVKTRIQIAEAKGYDTYTDYAFDSYGRGYTQKEAKKLLNTLREILIPMYSDRFLNTAFGDVIADAEVSTAQTMNMLYEIYSQRDDVSAEAYAYMTTFGLYDFDKKSENRESGSFTVYLPSFDTPYVFANVTETSKDFEVLSHEFGHFLDAYYRGGSVDLDCAETISLCNELLTIKALSFYIGGEDYDALLYDVMSDVFISLLEQSILTEFEFEIYALSALEVTPQRLDLIAKNVAEKYGLYGVVTFDGFLIDEVLQTPLYDFSYVISSLSAFEIYQIEHESSGEGVKIFSKLLCEKSDTRYPDLCKNVGLSSPFDTGVIKTILENIYESLIGRKFYEKPSAPDAA